jgi:hypothetical protein
MCCKQPSYFADSGREPTGQITFAVLRLAIPGPDVAKLVQRSRQLVIQADQQDRLKRSMPPEQLYDPPAGPRRYCS